MRLPVNPRSLTLEAGPIYRIERRSPHPSAVRCGPFTIAPVGKLLFRFDSTLALVGYASVQPETAAYETIVRRNMHTVARVDIDARDLLTINVKTSIRLLDIRRLASAHPVLTSDRYAMNQPLADDAVNAGYEGIAYTSAQQPGAMCCALFDSGMTKCALVRRDPLTDPLGNFHRVAFDAITGGEIVVV